MKNYFTIGELCKSTTAEQLGIKNEPNVAQRKNLQRLIDEVLNPLRGMYGSAIIVTSGFRCPKLNKAVKGSATSQHLSGEAADLKPKDGDVERLFKLAKHLVEVGVLECGQLIDEYNYSWVHISLPNAKHKNEILHIKN